MRVNLWMMLSAVLAMGLGGCTDQVNPRVATKLNQDAMPAGGPAFESVARQGDYFVDQ